MSDIPTDAYEEILRRVPAESLFRFRSVCKKWRTIIDDPQFTKVHINRGLGESWIMHKSKAGKLFLLPFTNFIDLKNNNRIECKGAAHIIPPAGSGISDLPLPSCNGMVLISSCGHKNSGWAIWSPFTGESLRLPLCNCPNYGYDAIGFGYDEANSDYKAIRIAEGQTFIFSVNIRAWRRVEDLPNDCTISDYRSSGALANGALHWMVRSVENTGLRWIVALNLTTETYRRISLPSYIVGQNLPLYIVALSGCLCLFTRWASNFFIWKMNENDDNSSDDRIWIRIICIKLEDDPFRELKINPIAYLENENQVLFHYKDDISDSKRDMFVWYDVGEECVSQFSMQDIYATDNLKYIYNRYSPQVIPASLIRFKRNGGVYEGVVLHERKRKRGDVEKIGRLIFRGSHNN